MNLAVITSNGKENYESDSRNIRAPLPPKMGMKSCRRVFFNQKEPLHLVFKNRGQYQRGSILQYLALFACSNLDRMTSFVVHWNGFATVRWTVLVILLYNPELSSSDFHIFGLLALKSSCFFSNNEVVDNV
ncbi:hypothetical protein NPIL_48431 [Nephila pilipes]|uniref:Uncharacterized protein n=1 Tax=Nephila pilipes TaxID=299642 RepID=A0A8X6TWU3_NEPPI|nr:hypothetical protein NPIL_48431 [Nephila pilipes]